MKKLIIIRGNSGSGKSTIAKSIREKAERNEKIAIIEQDYFRRFILKEKEQESENNIELIKMNVLFAFKKGYDVILEGILFSERYKNMLEELIGKFDKNYIYYLDIPFEETIKRHKTKYNAHEFGEKEMRGWYKEKDILNLPGEKIINKDFSENRIVERILNDAEL